MDKVLAFVVSRRGRIVAAVLAVVGFGGGMAVEASSQSDAQASWSALPTCQPADPAREDCLNIVPGTADIDKGASRRADKITFRPDDPAFESADFPTRSTLNDTTDLPSRGLYVGGTLRGIEHDAFGTPSRVWTSSDAALPRLRQLALASLLIMGVLGSVAFLIRKSAAGSHG